MRTLFLEVDTKKEARNLAPWACKFMKVCDGYIAYESEDDYIIAKNQR